MKSFVRGFVIGIVSATMVTGCGGGSSSTGAFTTGLEKSAPISSITAKGREQICTRARDWLQSSTTRAEICTFFGVVFTSDLFGSLGEPTSTSPVPACYEFVDTCTTAPASEEEDPASSVQACLLSTADALASCNAPIAELDSCLADSLAAYDTIFGSVSCEGAGEPNYVQNQLNSIQNLTASPSCLALKAKCPNVLVDESEGL